MKRILVLMFALAFILYIIPVSHSYASTWQKYPNNPVLTGRGSGYWEGGAALNGTIIKRNNQYQIWYEGNNGQGYRIGYATSPDGVNNWTISSTNIIPVGSSDGWEKETRNPYVMFDNSENIYKMWYTSMNSDHWPVGSDRFRVRYATSTDGMNWNVQSGWVMYGTTGKWDEGGISRGISVLKVNGEYKMWYTGTNTNNEGVTPYWRIGYATSPDGVNWTKQNNGDPVIVPTEPWEDNDLIYPNVIYENGIYKMWYTTSIADWPHQIVFATSIDGIHWTKPINENPVLTTSSSGFDSFYVGSPSVLIDNGEYRMWYSGQNTTSVSIGLATEPLTSSLPVPILKQTDPAWNTQIYDSADSWRPTDPTINDWGCAITSATMVLKYFGINNMPDANNTPLDPGSLNTWLKSQPDGYVLDSHGNKTGNLNWLAIPRLTKLVQLAGNNPNFQYDAVTYKRINTPDTATLTSDLQNNQPDILGESNHFVVATGIQGNTYTINDPYYTRLTLNDGYNNTFLSLGRYIGSHTDLSYIFLTAPTNVTVTIKDSQNNQIGDTDIEQPLANDSNPTQLSGDAIEEVYAATPSAGTYHVDVTGSATTPFTIHAYLYDVDGNVKLATFSGSITPQSPSGFFIDFNKQDSSSSKIYLITFDSTINDVKHFQKTKEIPFGLGQAFIALLQSAQKDSGKGKTTIAKIKLGIVVNLLNLLNTFRHKGISENAYQTLLTDFNYLKTKL